MTSFDSVRPGSLSAADAAGAADVPSKIINPQTQADKILARCIAGGNLFNAVGLLFVLWTNDAKDHVSKEIQDAQANKDLQNQIQNIENEIKGKMGSDDPVDCSEEIAALRKLCEDNPQLQGTNGSLSKFLDTLGDGTALNKEDVQKLDSNASAAADSTGGDSQIVMTQIQMDMKNLGNDYEFVSGAFNKGPDTLKAIVDKFR